MQGEKKILKVWPVYTEPVSLSWGWKMQLYLRQDICAFWLSKHTLRIQNHYPVAEFIRLDPGTIAQRCWHVTAVQSARREKKLEGLPEMPNQWSVFHLSHPLFRALQEELPKGPPWRDTEEVSACVMSRAINVYTGIDLPCIWRRSWHIVGKGPWHTILS